MDGDVRVQADPVESPGAARTGELPRRLRADLQRLRLLLPSEATLALVAAAIVGVYAGLATGLFANAIHLFHLVFFRARTLVAALSAGDVGAAWRARFLVQLSAGPWHLEYLLVGGTAIAGCLLLDRFLRPLGPGIRAPGGARPFRTLARLLGAGLVLFYALTMVAVFNRSFPAEAEGIGAQAPWAAILFVPAIGGLVVGLLLHHIAPGPRAHGVASVIEAVVRSAGRISSASAILRSLTAAITIGSGGSVGREGPVVEVGSAVGSGVGRQLEFSRANVTTLVGAGAAAGIASSFNAPIAGTMFALEIILRDFRISAFTPIVLAAVTSVLTARSLIGEVQEIVRPVYELVTPLEILLYAALGVAAGAVAHVYVRSLDLFESAFAGELRSSLSKKLGSLPFPLRVSLGGLLLGALALAVPRVLGTGYETMNAALLGQLGLGTLALVLVAKIVATSLTLGSGGAGGSFFPAMFLGAMLGGAFGTVLGMVFPGSTASPGAYALVGMGGVVAGATLAPITGIVMMFELTGNYEIILPLMVTCVIASTMTSRSLGDSMFTLRLRRRGVTLPAHSEEAVLRRLQVGQAMTRQVVTVPESLPFGDLVTLMTSTTYDTFPVVDASGRLTGLLSLEDVRPFLYESGLARTVVAKELARPPVPSVHEDDDLELALQRLGSGDTHLLPVVAHDDPRRLVGILSRRDILRAYGEAAREAEA